jgi:hypothetical protein
VEHGVDDVSAAGHLPIRVVATFEAGSLVLRPVGMPGVEVIRRLVGNVLEWHYGPSVVVRLRRD